METAFAAFTAFLIAALPLSVGVTKIVDTIRNLVDASGRLPKVTWNIAALAVGILSAYAFELSLLEPVAKAIPALNDWSPPTGSGSSPPGSRWERWLGSGTRRWMSGPPGPRPLVRRE